MKKSDQLKQLRTALRAKIKPLAESESLTDEERSTLNEHFTNLENLDRDIEEAVRNEEFLLQESGNGNDLSDGERRDLSKFSFVRAFSELLRSGGNADSITGLEGEMHQEALQERARLGLNDALSGVGIPTMVLGRASTGQNVTTPADGGLLLQDEAIHYYEALQEKLVLVGLGATYLSGLRGNLPLIKGGGFTSSWIPEGGEVGTSKKGFEKKELSPKNLMCSGATSKQLLMQSSIAVENMLRNDLINAIALGIQYGVLNGATNGPSGILNDDNVNQISIGADGGKLDWAKIVEFETRISSANALSDNMGWLTNPKVRGALKTTIKSSGEGAGFLWGADNNINGYKAAIGTVVPSNLTKGSSDDLNAMIFGNWSELLIGQWGGLDIVVDNITLAKKNEIQLIVNQFVDAGLRTPEAFAISKDVKI